MGVHDWPTLDDGDVWPTPSGPVPSSPPTSSSSSSRAGRLAAIAAAVAAGAIVAAVILTVVFWHYVVGAIIRLAAWKVLTR